MKTAILRIVLVYVTDQIQVLVMVRSRSTKERIRWRGNRMETSIFLRESDATNIRFCDRRRAKMRLVIQEEKW